MAIPVISAATLEYFSVILGEAPLMVSGDQNVTATAANPTGLRLAGGNLFRDYTPWAEHEINSWENGFGHAYIGKNGFWNKDAHAPDTVLGDLRLSRNFTSESLDVDKPTNVDWTTDPWVEGKIVRANDGRLYAFRAFEIFQHDEATDTWTSWFDVRDTLFDDDGTDPQYQDFYIIDMCEFDEYLIVVTRPRFRVTGALTGEFFLAQGAAFPAYYSMPNVFAIRTSDAFPAVVGDQDFFNPLLPLPAFGAIAVGPGWSNATQRIRSILCATACHQYGGYLFIGGSAGFAYTSGEYVVGGSGPSWWQLEEYVIHGQAVYGAAPGAPIVLKTPYSVSTKYGGDNWVTGFAGIQGQSIGDFVVYMSTSKSLFMLNLEVPTLVKVMDYSGVNVRNGKGMMAHQNDIYIPVNRGLFRFTQQGQTVPVGIDQVPESPISSGDTVVAGHVSLASTPGTLLSAIQLTELYSSSDPVDSYGVMALKGQGWQYTGAAPGQLFYAPATYSIFSLFLKPRSEANWDGWVHRSPFADNKVDDFVISGGTYYPDATIHLGFYSADSPLLEKDWQSLSVYGKCFDEDHTAEIQYKLLDSPVTCLWEYDASVPGVTWQSAGIIDSGNDAEFVLPSMNNCSTGRTSKWIAIKVILTGPGGGTSTPIVEGIKIKYFTPIRDYFRFSFATTLSKDCLMDGCGDLLTEYDQFLWDEEVRAAVCSVEPVKFRDVDGKWYEIRVESASRRIEKVNFSSTGRTWDISWSLVLVQVNSDTICEPLWSPPVCP